MKKVLFLLLCLLLIPFTSFAAPNGNDVSGRQIAADNNYYYMWYCPNDYKQFGIYRQAYNTTKKQLVVKTDGEVTSLFIANNKLYYVDAFILFQLDLKTKKKTTLAENVARFIVQRNTIYFIGQSYDRPAGNLYELPLTGGQPKQLVTGATNVFHNDETVFYAKNGIYTLAGKKLVSEAVSAPFATNTTLYFLTSKRQLVTTNLTGGARQNIANAVDGYHVGNSLLYISGGTLYERSGGKTYTLAKLPSVHLATIHRFGNIVMYNYTYRNSRYQFVPAMLTNHQLKRYAQITEIYYP